jgi:hypothetical protein
MAGTCVCVCVCAHAHARVIHSWYGVVGMSSSEGEPLTCTERAVPHDAPAPTQGCDAYEPRRHAHTSNTPHLQHGGQGAGQVQAPQNILQGLGQRRQGGVRYPARARRDGAEHHCPRVEVRRLGSGSMRRLMGVAAARRRVAASIPTHCTASIVEAQGGSRGGIHGLPGCHPALRTELERASARVEMPASSLSPDPTAQCAPGYEQASQSRALTSLPQARTHATCSRSKYAASDAIM